jgi:hypothetical protein
MKRFQTLLRVISAIGLVTAFATPTLAGKTVISDEELDEVTAAGQPKIVNASTPNGTATATNFQVNVFAAEIGGQKNFTALTFNNIFGENQVGNGVNIQSGADNQGFQLNNIIQSWGSAMATEGVTVDGQKGGSATCGAAGLIAKCNAQGGDASEGKIGLLWSFGDEISKAHSGNGPATASNVVVTIVATSFDTFAQSGLTALTVNNIVGFNQVANGLNISAGALNGPNIEGAEGGTSSGQRNVIEQWRGAPRGWTQAPTFSSTGNGS